MLNSKSPHGTNVPPMIGSTSNSYATVVNLSSMATFSAFPLKNQQFTVTELVVHYTTSNHKENTTTVVIVPWLIAPVGDLTDSYAFITSNSYAKSELVNAIYQQLSSLTENQEHVKQLQFIARIITVDKPLWVVDIIGPIGFSPVHLNNHFTGNSARALVTVEFDGIPTQILGGFGITHAPLPGFSHPPLCWANLSTIQNVPLRYLADVLDRMGCDPRGIVYVLYAKTETLRTSKHRHDRHNLNQKANSMASPTFIFQGPRHLKYFLDHFSNFANSHLPSVLMGYSTEDLLRGPTREDFRAQSISVKDYFLKLKSLARYISNIPGDRNRELLVHKDATAPPNFDHFLAISRLLVAAQNEMSPKDFAAEISKLVDQFSSNDMHFTNATSSHQRIQPFNHSQMEGPQLPGKPAGG